MRAPIAPTATAAPAAIPAITPALYLSEDRLAIGEGLRDRWRGLVL